MSNQANNASVSGSTGYNIPVNALDGGGGGDAAPSGAGSFFGGSMFNDGSFVIGNGNTTPSSQSQIPQQALPYMLPGDLGYNQPLFGTSGAGGVLSSITSGGGGSLLLIGGLVLVGLLLLRRRA